MDIYAVVQVVVCRTGVVCEEASACNFQLGDTTRLPELGYLKIIENKLSDFVCTGWQGSVADFLTMKLSIWCCGLQSWVDSLWHCLKKPHKSKSRPSYMSINQILKKGFLVSCVWYLTFWTACREWTKLFNRELRAINISFRYTQFDRPPSLTMNTFKICRLAETKFHPTPACWWGLTHLKENPVNAKRIWMRRKSMQAKGES